MNASKLEEAIKQEEEYRENVLRLLQDSSQKVAYHFNCPDGIISASIVSFIFSSMKLTFVPIDYPLLKDKVVKDNLDKTNWFAIVDLSPFNVKEIEFFFDHHISNTGHEIKAKKHVFDPQAPSAASLIAKFFSETLPDYLKELADITEITDTASYNTPPPLELKKNLKEFTWDEKIWFIEDVCKSTYTIKEHNQLIKILKEKGLQGLWVDNIIERVRVLRQSRKEAVDIAEEIQIKDFTIIIDYPHRYNTAFIAGEIMKRGSKGAAYISVYPDNVKVSLRLSKLLKSEDVEKYRVDLLAEQMEGGGHKGAAGAELENLEQVMGKINSWTVELKLETVIVDLRKK